MVAVGLALGLGVAVALGRVLNALLFEVQPADPVPLMAVALLFAAVAMLACYIPARRATKIEPMVALRYE